MQTTSDNRVLNSESSQLDRISDSTAVSVPSLAISAFLGLAFVFIAGFAQIDAVHNAAHDTRHSIGFPCH